MYTKYLVLVAVMVSFAAAQELKNFQGVYLSGRDSTHSIPVVLKIEQVGGSIKFTEYKISNEHEEPLVEVRTYTMKGTKAQKQHSKVRVGLKKRQLRIETVTDSSGISGDGVHGTRTKEAEEWGLTPDLQMLTQKARKDWQLIQIDYDCCGVGVCHLGNSIMNDRTTVSDQRVYTRRSLLSEALAEASRN